MRLLSTRKAKIAFAIKRSKDFMSIFTRNRRGMLGISILVFFIVLATFGPLLTPYDPVRLPAHPTNPPLADRFAKPLWYKYLVPEEELSENVEPMRDPHFKTATCIEEFEFTTNLAGQGISTPQFISDMGKGEEQGSVAIVFNREEDQNPFGEVTANLTKVFNYPHTAPPKRFIGDAAILVKASEDIPVKTVVVIEKEGGERRLEWWNQTFETNGTKWVTSYPYYIDSNSDPFWLEQKFGSEWKINPAKTMFSEPGNYRYVLEIMFNDTQRPRGEKVEATVYIDDFHIRVLGDSFGLFGTDQYGRDIFTQLVYGARISLIVGLLSALFSTAIGLIVGLTAGYMGKFVDNVLMRFTDMLLVLPDTPLYIVLMAVLRPSVWNLILLITLIGWTGFARVVRSSVLSIRERPFIEAAKAVGAGKFRIIVRHIMPNVMNLVYVTLAMAVPYAITSEAWLSWLGLYDPYVMTWGRMLHDAQSVPTGIEMWWWIVPPGLCIALISLSFILLGYALDEILNPKLRKRY